MEDYYQIHCEPSEFKKAITDLHGYWKTQSILYLKSLCLPVLNGIIITRWNNKVYEAVVSLCVKNGWNTLLLRHDKKPEVPLYPRGGYIVKLSDIQQEAIKYFSSGRILILLEPFSPFDNSYNVNILFEDEENLLLEIVGPGFDASDLQRGDITPHETIEINIGALKRYPYVYLSNFKESIKKHIIIEKEHYKSSVKQRYLKIAGRLIDLGELIPGKRLSEDDLIFFTKQYLKNNKHNILLLNEKNYIPISMNYLSMIFYKIHDLPENLLKVSEYKFPFVVSSSFVNKGTKHVFWDIVFPRLKYQSLFQQTKRQAPLSLPNRNEEL